jgi:hypothetical protein
MEAICRFETSLSLRALLPWCYWTAACNVFRELFSLLMSSTWEALPGGAATATAAYSLACSAYHFTSPRTLRQGIGKPGEVNRILCTESHREFCMGASHTASTENTVLSGEFGAEL